MDTIPLELSTLARKFRDEFARTFPDIPRDETRDGKRFLRVPAAHPTVGDLLVWDDAEELTIGVGDHHHEHHSLYMYSDLPRPAAEDHVVDEALDFIRELFANRIVLGLSRDGQKLRWSSTYHLSQGADPSDARAIGYEEYFWNGPRHTQHRQP